MPPPACDRCDRRSVTLIRYSGQHLCDDHFTRFVDRRIRKEVRKQGGLPADSRILVAASGGKDSTVALHALDELTRDRPDVELVALTIDEGIEGYRPEGLRVAADAARALGIDHVVKRTRDLAGAPIDEIHAKDPARAACSYCGVFRRRLMNDAATELDADLLVTGHNLDDTAQSIFMNLTNGDLARLARLGPHTETKQGLVPRRMPLRTIPEREVYLYATLKEIAFHDGVCPYAAEGQRTVHRDVLARLEDAAPGTRHSLLSTLDELKPLLADRPPQRPLGACDECGEPASGDRCQACTLADEARAA